MVRDDADALRRWYGSRESDSVSEQRARTHMIHAIGGDLERLVPGVQPERRVVLCVGEVAAKASVFNKGAYDFYSEGRETLEPGSHLVFERTDEYYSMRNPRERELYVGGWGILIAVSKLARTLHEGSQLVLMDAEEARILE